MKYVFVLIELLYLLEVEADNIAKDTRQSSTLMIFLLFEV